MPLVSDQKDNEKKDPTVDDNGTPFSDTGEMMRLRVVKPKKAQYDIHGNMVSGWVFNGNVGFAIKDADGKQVGHSPGRVYIGWETAFPLYRPFRDEEGNHLRRQDGTLMWRKQNVPSWAELIEIVPAPRGWQPAEVLQATSVSPLSRANGGVKAKAQKSFGRSQARAADTQIGE